MSKCAINSYTLHEADAVMKRGVYSDENPDQ